MRAAASRECARLGRGRGAVRAEPPGRPPRERESGVAGKTHAVKACHQGRSQERLEREPAGRSAGARTAVPVAVVKIHAVPVEAKQRRLVEHGRADLGLEVVQVPRVAVADAVEDARPGVGHLGQAADEARSAFGDEVAVLDVLVEHVARAARACRRARAARPRARAAARRRRARRRASGRACRGRGGGRRRRASCRSRNEAAGPAVCAAAILDARARRAECAPRCARSCSLFMSRIRIRICLSAFVGTGAAPRRASVRRAALRRLFSQLFGGRVRCWASSAPAPCPTTARPRRSRRFRPSSRTCSS